MFWIINQCNVREDHSKLWTLECLRWVWLKHYYLVLSYLKLYMLKGSILLIISNSTNVSIAQVPMHSFFGRYTKFFQFSHPSCTFCRVVFYYRFYGKLASRMCDPIRKGMICEIFKPHFVLYWFTKNF